MTRNTGLLILAAAAAAFAPPLEAAVRMPRIFGDAMVLQRDRPVPVWGLAAPGETVTVAFAGQVKGAVAGDDGRWTVTLDPLPACREPAALKVTGVPPTGHTHAFGFGNVVVGDVWLCAGQSGAGMVLRRAVNAEAEAEAGVNPMIRYTSVWLSSSARPQADIKYMPWLAVTNPALAQRNTGVGHFLARDLNRQLDVPIGVINCFGEAAIEPWICPAGYRLEPGLARYLPMIEAWDSTTERGRQTFADYLGAIRAWIPAAEAALAARQAVPAKPDSPLALPAGPGLPTTTFNAMVHPLIPFALRGVIWLHGEVGVTNPAEYCTALRALIGGWRAAWGEEALPFLIAQAGNRETTASSPDHPAGGGGAALIREAQRLAAASLSNVSLAVTLDITGGGNMQDVGARLARLALAVDGGSSGVPGGPHYKGFTAEGGRIRVAFDHVGAGLMIAEKQGLEPARETKGGALTWFAVAGADKAWHWADAVIEGDSVVVSSPAVPNPVAVRYAFVASPLGANLYNRDGFPACPFRTDDW